MNNSSLVDALLPIIHEAENNYQQKIVTAEALIRALELERQNSSFLDEITDEYLKKRLMSLGTAPLDTLLREAGVVLEDRLRKAAGPSEKILVGVDLVNYAFRPEKGGLVFSTHPSEQIGAKLLYMGGIQFVRNPPMHKLIEYQASMAQTLMKLIDILLVLLAEAPFPVEEEDVKLTDIRRMLTRMPILEGQRLLYQALYKAGEKGLTGAELSVAINRTRQQMAGILGALGVRINGTEGLENKGAVSIILEISHINGGDYVCRMKSILRKALEQEHIV